MPKVTTEISYEEEDFGDAEVISYSKHVEDLDVHSWLWYLVKITEQAGYDCEQLQLLTSRGTIYKTDL